MKGKQCPSCVIGTLEMKNIKGSLFPWKQYKELELMFDHDALVCNYCDEIILKSSDCAILDDLLEKSDQLYDEIIKTAMDRYRKEKENDPKS